MTVENEFSPAFSTAFDASALVNSGVQPCIDVNWLACMTAEEYNALEPEQVLVAELFAQSIIQQLTGFQVGMCPITVRPCLASCFESSGVQEFSIVNPHIRDGVWYNTCGCSPRGCECSWVEHIYLDGPVGAVTEVKVDGAVVDPAYYRVDNFTDLVRVGGPEWPTCQDMSAPDTEVGTMSVSYVRGAALDPLGGVVAGILAREYLQACKGAECRLPASVVSLTRQGVSMQFDQGVFPGGVTGIDTVDLWIRQWNPYGIKSPTRVKSPDAAGNRRTTWN